MFPKTCLSTLFLLFLAFNSFSQEKSLTFTLDEAIQYALEHNNDAKNSRLDAEINKKRALEIITEGLPQLFADVNYKHNVKLPISIVPGEFVGQPGEDFEVAFGTPHNVNADFMVTQLIVDGRYFIGLKANKTLKAMGAEQVELSEIDVKNNVTKSYYAALVAQEGITIVEKNLETLKKLIYETGELYKNGFAEELDVDRITLQLSNMESTQRRVQLQLELAHSLLKYNMGLDYTIDVVLADKLETLLANNSVIEDAVFNHESRAEFRLLSLQWNMRGYDAQRIRAGYLPSLSAFGGYGFNAQRQQFDVFDFNEKWFNVAYWGLELHVPIFDSYKKGSVYQQKKLEQQKIQNQIEDFKQSSNLQAAQARSDYKTAKDEFDNQKKNMDLAQKIYNKVKIKYEEGVGYSIELAQAEADLTETQSSYINAMYEMLSKRSELMKVLGNY